MLKKFLLLSLCVFALSPNSVFAMHHDDTAKDRGGQTTLTCNFGRVERAGVAIVKDYGPTMIPALRFAVLVGADAKRTYKTSTGQVLPYTNFFGGGCETKDKYSTVTAIEELYEETGKSIDLQAASLLAGKDANYFGYAYSGDFATTNTQGKNYTQLFFYRKDNASVTGIETALTAAANNPRLSSRFKETKRAFAIPLQDILDRARAIHALEIAGQHQQVKDEKNYIFKTRGSGDGTNRKEVYLDPQYMRNLARDITRDANNLTSICRNISAGVVQ